MAENHKKKIAIIGAGYAGAGAAFVLKKLGHEVTVMTNEDHIGGGAPSVRIEDETYNFGAQFFYHHHKNFMNLAKHFQLKIVREKIERMYAVGEKDTIEYRGGNFFTAFQWRSLLDPTTRRFFWKILKASFGSGFPSPFSPPHEGPDLSLEEYFRGADPYFLHHIIFTLVKGFVNADPFKSSSIAMTHFVSHFLLSRHIYRIETGISRLAEEMLNGCDLRLRVDIEKITWDSQTGGFRVRTSSGDHIFDRVIFACPVPAIFKMASFENENFVDCLKQFNSYQRMIVVCHLLDEESTPGLWLLGPSFPSGLKNIASIWYRKSKEESKGGMILTTMNEEKWDYLNSLPEENISDLAHEEISKFLPKNARLKVKGYHIRRYHYAFPNLTKGYYENLKRFDELKKEIPYGFCGHWRAPWWMEGALRSGLYAAYEAHHDKKEVLDLYKELNLNIY